MTTEPQILIGRRAFAVAQHALAGVAESPVPLPLDVGWYDTVIDPETGSFAVVSEDDVGAQVWIGRTLLVAYRGRSVNVYVLGARAVSTPLALARRAFLGLAAPSAGVVEAHVQVLA